MRSLLFFFLLPVLLTALASAGEPAPASSVRHCRLSAAIDIDASRVTGSVTIPAKAGEEVRLVTGQLAVIETSVSGRTVDARVKDGVLTVIPEGQGDFVVRFEGTFRGGESIGDRNYGVVSSAIDRRGVSLTGLWYPQPAFLASWTLTVELPDGYEAVSEADSITRTTKKGVREFRFDFDHPVESLSLVATDRYEVTQERYGNIDLFAYFFKEDRELAKGYLKHAKGYFELYEKMLGPYPYKRFSIVENFLPTGYSLPTYTLLGQEVVRLPFIVETSLGHEILHQWFGDSVYTDDRSGNWAEGVTTYLADHWYEEQKGKGWEYRKQLLVNYGAYVHGKDEMALRDFRSREDLASRAVGYGKAAMVFHMLRKSAGDEKFFAALRDFIGRRRFEKASWQDIEAAFSRTTGKDLSGFFHYWIDGTGLPEINVENAAIRRKGDAFEISFDAVRKGISLPVGLPVTVSFLRGGTKREVLQLDADRKSMSLLVDEEPSRAVFDEDYDLARQLTPDETPPVIARLAGEEKPLIALPTAGRERYRAVIDDLRQRGGVEQQAAAVTDADVKASTVVVLGRDNPLVDRLFGGGGKAEGGFSVKIRKNPWNRGKIIAVFDAASAEETDAAYGKIYHYGKYSALSFEKGRNTAKRIDPSDRGILWDLRPEPVVLDLSLIRKLSNALDAAASKRIIYVGEYHDRFSNHAIESEIIDALHRRYPKIAVGMEMFQRPFQKALDEYIAGTIDEREFLVRSEYFKRWGFDYNLYKPILDYCRREKVPVIALNMQREITEKVARGGFDSLTAEERKQLPAEMDFSDETYRERIRQAFGLHRGQDEKSFEFFLQAQVLWDETMAESIDRYLARNPDRQMVVVAGGGHLVYGSGIPGRSFRRNGLPYTILLNDGDIDPGAADFIILPAALDGATAPRLQATFREQKGRVILNDFVKDSPARKAGLRADDVVIGLDGVPVKGLQDLKIGLYLKRPGDKIRVTVERKRFLFGVTVMSFEVQL